MQKEAERRHPFNTLRRAGVLALSGGGGSLLPGGTFHRRKDGKSPGDLGGGVGGTAVSD